ncbi:DUF2065 domain-containing protein [Azospirillum sp. A39]|uniref:DUF2065 domain-containing protein n=1 Tax=Azospirillum sp. A39 TaxID=3462279 RepID=UPI004045F7FC
MNDLWTALALVLVVEGVLYALFPGPMRRLIAEALTLPEGRLRMAGLLAAVVGVGLVWMVRGT